LAGRADELGFDDKFENKKSIYAFKGNNHIRTMHALFIQTNLFLDSKMSDRMNQAVSKGMVNRRNSFYT